MKDNKNIDEITREACRITHNASVRLKNVFAKCPQKGDNCTVEGIYQKDPKTGKSNGVLYKFKAK